MRTLCSILCVLGLAVPAAAQTDRLLPAPVGVSAPKAPSKSKLVCESMATTGSRLGTKKVCHTASEWAEIKAAERQDIERLQANRYKDK